jgi:hypothetical protein
MNAEIKILGTSDEDTCGCCGKTNLKRTVRVEVSGEEQHWGVICASKIRGGSGNATDIKYLSQFAKAVDAIRSVIASGGGERDIMRANRQNFPCVVRDGIVKLWASRHNGKHDAEIAMAAIA